ncbi:MAG: hypothetical protein V3R99_12735 [Thermoguttaceae bacterium]
MADVQQAIFTSAETDRSAGYQVVARSPGVSDADARQLTVWGPSHDSLLELGSDAASLNFFPLPSGAYCVSRTTPAGWEYSGRGGHRVYTHCLVVSPEVLERFANNPFALARAARASGVLDVRSRIPSRLEPVALAGGATPVDQTLLTRLAAQPGPERLAMFLHRALESSCLAVAGKPSAEQLIAGLISCLPPQCRTEFSFSTGLKYSSRRPFRIVALSEDKAEQRWVAHQSGVSVLDLHEELTTDSVSFDGWARLIGRVVSSGRVSFLATELSKRRFQLTLDDLSALGLQLLEELDATALQSDHQPVDGPSPTRLSVGFEKETPQPSTRKAAHAAHTQFEKSGDAATSARQRENRPSKTLQPQSQEALEKLELLDDVVYEAINGEEVTLERLKTLLPEVLDELEEELVIESRAQYLRYALSIWEQGTDSTGLRNPLRAMQALDVLCLLFDDV